MCIKFFKIRISPYLLFFLSLKKIDDTYQDPNF